MKLAVAGILVGSVLALIGVWQMRSASSNADRFAVPAAIENYPNYGRIPHSSAVTFWRDRSAERPNDYTSRTNWAGALMGWAGENGDLELYEQAEDVLREVLEEKPDFVPARLSLASALQSQHKFSEALAIGTELRSDDPDSIEAMVAVGDASFEIGDYDTARELYATLVGVERSAPVVSRLARIAWIDGDLDETIELSIEALSRSSSVDLRADEAAFYWYQLGHYRFENGDIDGAISDFEQAITISADTLAANEELPFVLASAGRIDEALDSYGQLLEGGGAADVHGLYADLLRREGRIAAADEHEELARVAAEETLGRFPAENRHLIGYFVSRDPARALELAEGDFLIRQDVQGYDALAWTLFHNGRSIEAAEAIDMALIHGTRDADIFYHAAEIYAALGDEETSRSYLDQLFDLNADFDPFDRYAAGELRSRVTQ